MGRINFYKLLPIFLVSIICLGACTSKNEPASPIQTFKTYIKASKQKDTTTMKLLLSSATMKMHEQEARSQNVTVDDIVKRDTMIAEGQTTVEFRNEKIDGDKATLEYRNASDKWEIVPFVLEDGEWKIDKKSFADQIMNEIEQRSQQFDESLDKAKQPD